MKTVPMYINAKKEAYCQYCLEGIAAESPKEYTLRERESDECFNCGGEHTPEDREYSIVEECKPVMTIRQAINADLRGACGGKLQLVKTDCSRQPYAVISRGQPLLCELDRFTSEEITEILAAASHKSKLTYINW